MESEFKPLSERIDRKVILFVSVFFIVIVSAVVVYVNFKKEPPPQLDLYKVQKQELEITITEMGDVKALRNTEVRLGFGMDQSMVRWGGPQGGGMLVFSFSPGMSTSTQPQILYLIPEGTRAQAGDTLIRLDTSGLKDQRADLVENLKTAKQKYDDEVGNQALDKYDYEESIQNASFKLQRQRLQIELYQYSSESVKQQAQLSYQTMLRDSVRLISEWEGDRIDNQHTIQRCQDNIKQVQDQIQSLDMQIKAYTVIAPYPALVIYATDPQTGQKIRQGDKVNTWQAIVTLPDLSTITAVMQINDIDRSKVWVGQEGKVRLEAYPGVVFKGVITDFTPISRSSQEQQVQMSFGGQMMWWGGGSSSSTTTYSNVKVFEANLKLDGTDERLKPGMTATIDLVIERLQEVITVPLSAIFERETSSGAKTYVYLVNSGNNLQEKEVVIGKQNSLMAEVKDGLKEGDTVLKQYPEGAGMKYGYYAEVERRKEATAQLDTHFKTMEELGINYDYDKAREQLPIARTEIQYTGKDTVLKKTEQPIPKEGNIFSRIINRLKTGAQDSTKIKK